MKHLRLDWPVFLISGGVLLAFVIAALINAEAVSQFVDVTFAWSSEFFGAYWQILMLLTFLIAIFMSVMDLGKVRLGDRDLPEISTFKWFAMVMTTLLAGGGVFWAAAEPMYHYLDTPPLFDTDDASASALHAGLAQGFYIGVFLLGQ
ncbi:putative glycine betaine transporter [Geomicrobium sp. JCM 19055]|nr:putative glycine betaine transporter [Geomicrobium sp. JCM 19055]